MEGFTRRPSLVPFALARARPALTPSGFSAGAATIERLVCCQSVLTIFRFFAPYSWPVRFIGTHDR
jgi:hypothetical protein